MKRKDITDDQFSRMECEQLTKLVEEKREQIKIEWDKVKLAGAEHHKTGGGNVEPIDLYRAGGILKPFAIACIIKYAFRNRNKPIHEKDLDKIIHYAEMLRVIAHEGG